MEQQLIPHQVGQYTVQTENFNPNTNAADNMTNSLTLKCNQYTVQTENFTPNINTANNMINSLKCNRSSIWVRKFKLTMIFKFQSAHIFTL
jgi:hypothetical protein